MPSLLRWITANARSRTLAAVAAGALAGPAVLAQAPPAGNDLLDQTRRLQQVATQQAEANIRLTLSETARLEKTDRPKAVEQYKQLLQRLENDQALAEDRRATLVRVVKDRIRVTEAAAAQAAEDDAARKAHEQATDQAAADRQPEERGQVKQAIDAIAALRKEGKVAEARRQAAELLKDHPNNVAVQVLNGINSAADMQAEATTNRKDMEQGFVTAARDLERSLVIPKGDVEFPPDWKEKTERRRKALGVSDEELRVLQALAKPISVEFKASRLQDAIDYISALSGRPIFLDKSVLDENQLNYDTPVTFSVKAPVATRTVLRGILNQVGLAYVVRDNLIQITTQARAKDMMVTKAYYIGDLVAVNGLFGGAPKWGAALDQAQLAQNVGGIVEMITSSLDPMSWQGKGGLGTIGFNIPTMSLIVRQSAEVHAMIRSGLYR